MADTYNTQDVVPEFGDDPSLGVLGDENIDDGNLVVKKTKRKRKTPLTTNDLIAENKGINILSEKTFANFKPSYSNPVSDLDKLMQRYVDWAYMIKAVDFSEFLHLLKSTNVSKAEITQHLNEMRDKQYAKMNPEFDRSSPENHDEEMQTSGILLGSDDESENGETNVHQQKTSASDTVKAPNADSDLQEKIRRNRELALKRRQEKLLKKNEQSIQNGPVDNSKSEDTSNTKSNGISNEEAEMEYMMAQQDMEEHYEEPDEDEYAMADAMMFTSTTQQSTQHRETSNNETITETMVAKEISDATNVPGENQSDVGTSSEPSEATTVGQTKNDNSKNGQSDIDTDDKTIQTSTLADSGAQKNLDMVANTNEISTIVKTNESVEAQEYVQNKETVHSEKVDNESIEDNLERVSRTKELDEDLKAQDTDEDSVFSIMEAFQQSEDNDNEDNFTQTQPTQLVDQSQMTQPTQPTQLV